MLLVRRAKRFIIDIGSGGDVYATAPIPLVSDGFFFVFGVADGKGHTAGAASYMDTTAGMGGDGAAWTVSAGSTWGTTDGRALCSVLGGTTAYTYFDAGVADVHLEATCIRSGGAVGILLRWVDSSNYAYVTMTNTNLRVHQVIAGTPATLYDAAFTYSSNALLEVDVTGTGVTVTYNSAVITTQTLNAALTNATKHGMWTNNTGNSIGRIACYDLATYPAGEAVNLSRATVTISDTSDRTSALVLGATVTQHSFVNATDTDLSRTSSDPLWGTLGVVAIHLRHFGFSNNMAVQDPAGTEAARVASMIAGNGIDFTEHDAMLTLLEANGVTEVVLKVWGFPEWMLDAATGASSVLQTFVTTYRAEAAAYVQAFIKRYNTDATVAGISIIAADWGHEQKGGYSSDMARFVADYNAIYAAVKAQDATVDMAGPYIVIFGNGSVNFGQADAVETREAIESSKRTDFETFTAGATAFDILSFDAKTWVDAAPTLTYDEAIELFGYWGRYIEKLKQLTGYTAQPLMASEAYGFNINDYTDFSEPEQAAMHAAMLWYLVHHGVTYFLHWIIEKPTGEEKYGYWNSTDDNPTSAVTTTPAYAVHQYFKDNFGTGVALYPVTVTGDAAGLLAMASFTKLLLINLRPAERKIVYEGIGYTLAAYEPLVIDREIAYLLRDEFTTPLSAGSVNGTAAEPGPGTRVVLDAGADLTLASGLVRVGVNPGGWNDPAYWLDSVTRVPGRILKAAVSPFNTFVDIQIGWSQDQSGRSNTHCFRFTTGGILRVRDSGADGAAIGTYTATALPIVIVLRATGAFFVVYRAGHWLIEWISATDSTSPIYPVSQVWDDIYDVDFMRIPDRLWLPTPIASDGFSAWGTSDGLGHAETSGVGSGGSGQVWFSDVGTWTATAGAANASALSGGVAFATVIAPTIDVFVAAKLTRSAGNLGIVVRYADSSNYITAHHDGTNAVLTKVVAGTPTVVITAAATYSAGAQIRVSSVGTAFRLYYNNALVGSQQTISDAGLQTGTKHGLYTTDTANTFDDFTCYATGTGGEYDDALDAI